MTVQQTRTHNLWSITSMKKHMNRSLTALVLSLFAAGLGCNSSAEQPPPVADANAKPAVAAAKASHTTKSSSKATAPSSANAKSDAKPPTDVKPPKDTTPSDVKPPADTTPSGVKGAIFMLSDKKARLLDAKGKELSSFATDAKGDYTFYDALKEQVFVYHDSALHTVKLSSKKTELFTKLPKVSACKLAPNALKMFSSWSLGLTTGGKALCVRLQDNTESNMKVSIGYQIDTASKNVITKVTSDYDRLCSEPADEEFCLPDDALSFAHKDPKKAPLPSGMEVGRYECHVKHNGKTIKVERPKGAKGWCDLSLEGFTPSGRFIGVTTLLSEEGEVKRTLDVIDLKSGKLIDAMRTTITPETRLDWDLDSDALLVAGNLLLLGDAPKVVKLNTSAIFIGKK